MLSKSKIKLIRSLEHKKFRNETGLFLAEGDKLVRDILPYFQCRLLAATADWLASVGQLPDCETAEISADEMHSASLMRTPQHVLALFEQPQYDFKLETLDGKLVLALDGIQDPGNMGTIMRIADWFGIDTLLCSSTCADIYNPKTVQATMGALARVKVHYVDLVSVLNACKGKMPIYGTFLDGEDMYATPLSASGIIVMGSEGRGISREVEKCVTHKLLIPNYPAGAVTSESLNVSAATAIMCAEFRRQLR